MELGALMDLDKEFILPSYTKIAVNFVAGKNATLYTKCGRDFIDFGSGIGVCSVGHANPVLNANIKDQIDKLTHLSNLYLNELQAKLAQKIVNISGLDARIFFSNSGAEANECAIKIARKFGEKNGKNRYKIITLQSSFHGRTIATLRATGQEKLHQHFGPFPDGFCIAKDIADIYNWIDSKTCAVMLELVQGEGGVSAFDKNEIKELASFLKTKDILLMIDEVQTGIYRSGKAFASQVYEIKPDVITMAKGLAGGIPIGATLSTLKDIFNVGDHGSTFGGNFLSSRAALCVIEILEEQEKSKKLEQSIKRFDCYLEQILDKFPHLFLDKSGIGLMRGLKTRSVEVQDSIIQSAFEERVLILKSGRNVVRFLPALTISDKEIQDGFERLTRACTKIDK